MEKIGFFETWNANAKMIEKSSSRLWSGIIIAFAIVVSLAITYSVCKVAIETKSIDGLIGAGAAIATAFTAMAGGAMVFLFNQKKTEINNQKQDKEMF